MHVTDKSSVITVESKIQRHITCFSDYSRLIKHNNIYND